MKKKLLLFGIALMAICSMNAMAQEKSDWSTGVDVYSSYVWRGTKFGSGPAMQPTLKYTKGGFSIGGWGNYCFSTNEATEADLFAGYTFTLGKTSTLAFNITDYYFPGTPKYFDGNSHYFEPQVVLGLGKFTVSGAYMGNADATYVEAGYTAGPITLFAGAGDKTYTADAKFNFCNLGIKTTKSLKITDSFSVPINAGIILNPSTEQLNIVVGFTLAN